MNKRTARTIAIVLVAGLLAAGVYVHCSGCMLSGEEEARQRGLTIVEQIPADLAERHIRLYKMDIFSNVFGTDRQKVIHQCYYMLDRYTDLMVKPEREYPPYKVTITETATVFHNPNSGERMTCVYLDTAVTDEDLQNLVYRLRFDTTRRRAYRNLVWLKSPAALSHLQALCESDEPVISLGSASSADMEFSRYTLGEICRMAIGEIEAPTAENRH